MEDPLEWRRLVESIRSDLGIDEGGEMSKAATIAQNSLRILSEELYTKSTRFLLELIQNADDNAYASGTTPQLSIVYRTDGFLWFGCNELGFSEANLRALCTVSESIKKVAGNKKGYIGEKGMGFKSVFRVADVVWIKSGALSFKFDKNQPLGMVAPIWTEFNATDHMDERTMFCFHIPEKPQNIPEKAHRDGKLGITHPEFKPQLSDRDLVRNDVTDLEAELLLFLRQLRSINITILKPDGGLERSHQLRRQDDDSLGYRLTELSRLSPGNNEEKSSSSPEDALRCPDADERALQMTSSDKFLVCHHVTEEMPFHEKRPGVSESDLLLALPVDDNLQPVLHARRVYNFLPVRSYGFPFVLQADFILAAPRETLQEDVPWNLALVAAARQLFVESVQKFNELGILRYTWPQYLTSHPKAHDTVFAGFVDSLVQQLRRQPVLLSEASTMERPSDLQCARRELTDGSEPLLTGSRGLRSFAYHAYRWQDLKALGIEQQSAEEFISLLHAYVERFPQEFRQQHAEWQSRLAAAISATGFEDSVKGLSIIPLRDGNWVSAKTKKLFFPDIEEGTTVPSGIDVEIIGDEAAADFSRRRLFDALGVYVLDEAEAFGLILQQHARKQEGTKSWSVNEVVEHAWFLFRAKARPSDYDLRQLLVASCDGKLRRGHQTYMDIPGSTNPVSRLLGNTVPFLHEQYLEWPKHHPIQDPAGHWKLLNNWSEWLYKHAGVRTLPRLATSGTISAEFEAIIRTSRNNDWLQLLKNEISVYSADLQALENDMLRSHLSNVNVLCVDGNQRPLKDVYFPTVKVLSEPLAKGNAPMIVVDNADDARWNGLDHSLHLRRDVDANLFIGILFRMREGRCYFSTDDVKRMYGGLARRFNYHVKQAFQSKELIYISSPQPAKWVKLDACRWDAPSAIFTLFALNQRYKQNSELFVRKLYLGNATAADVVGELKKLNGRIDSIDTIRNLLEILSGYVEGGQLNIDSLRGLEKLSMKLLPVKLGGRSELCSFVDNNWFIEEDDTPLLVELFQDIIRVVDCDFITKRRPRTLLEKMGGLANLLSERYTIENETQGEISFDPISTKALRAKAEYLSRLVDVSQRQEALSRLSALQVCSADAVVIRRFVKIDGKQVYGRNVEGRIILKADGSIPTVYYSRRGTDPGNVPFFEISDQFPEALNIQKRYQNLAMIILMTDATAFIESELERVGRGRPKDASDANAAPKLATGAKVLDLSRLQKKPLLNTSTEKTVKIGSSVRFGAKASQAMPECHSPLNEHAYSGSGETLLNERDSAPLSSTRLFDGHSRLISSNRSGVRMKPTASGRSGGASAFDGTGNKVDTRKLDLSSMRTQLDEAIALQNEQGTSFVPQQAGTSDGTTATDAELAIGRAGETFVYELLKRDLDVGGHCWTSESRSFYPELGSFVGNEADYADFTISEPEKAAKMTDWLVNTIGITGAGRWLEKTVTYHIEVKTTSGHLSEPFELRNNQARLAKEWHASSRDVPIIVRVYHILSNAPAFHVYLDPVELRKNGVLNFEAKGGFYVMPA